eukprot:COSAG02_NODE_10279_length_1979_cov_1.568617_5_plen_36_part_00
MYNRMVEEVIQTFQHSSGSIVLLGCTIVLLCDVYA